MEKQNSWTLIESESVIRDYGLPGANAIVSKSDGKRYMICDGFVYDGLAGGTVRWKNGLAIQVKPSDTLAALSTAMWNDDVTLMEAIKRGLDPVRPVCDWDGYIVEAIAKAVDLA